MSERPEQNAVGSFAEQSEEADGPEQAQAAADESSTEDNSPDEATSDLLIVESMAGEPSHNRQQDRAALKAVIEAAIYITDEPLSVEQIASGVERPVDQVQTILSELMVEYAALERGLSIRELAGGFKMATKAEHHDSIRRFVKKLQPPLKLSLPALESLAVVAYKQPITAPEIMDIRGVQGTSVLKTLLDRKLIATAGRKNVLGKPMMYRTTQDFLVQFGLSSLAELPTLKEFEELGRLAFGDSEELTQATANDGEPSARQTLSDPDLNTDGSSATTELGEELAPARTDSSSTEQPQNETQEVNG